ncbi:MAG: hypothetical protein VB023_06890 [Oscillibacter sp.]|nr:hypothetical protein [Oscillibacter sp.]
MTNKEKEQKQKLRDAKKKRKDHQLTGVGYGACVGFLGLGGLAVSGHIAWGGAAMAVCILGGWLIALATDPSKKKK